MAIWSLILDELFLEVLNHGADAWRPATEEDRFAQARDVTPNPTALPPPNRAEEEGKD